jgi:hypothetical protein
MIVYNVKSVVSSIFSGQCPVIINLPTGREGHREFGSFIVDHIHDVKDRESPAVFITRSAEIGPRGVTTPVYLLFTFL